MKNDLADAAKELNEALGKSGGSGKLQKGDDAFIEKLKNKYSLCDVYVNFLKNYNPKEVVIDTFPFESLDLYSAEMLEKGQEGYSYNPVEKKEIKEWDKNWVVIAYDAGDPYFIDLSEKKNGDCKVYTAAHGEGEWEPQLVASSFVQFLTILAAWLDVRSDKDLYDQKKMELTKEGKDILAEKISKIDLEAYEGGYWYFMLKFEFE